MTRRRAPGTPAGLDTTQVIDAGMAVLERDGLTGVSMRAVAHRLGVAPNALYGHVPGKDALLDAMTERLLDGAPIDEDAGWRIRLQSVARHAWEALRPHPALAARYLMHTRPGDGTTALRRQADDALAAARVPAERRAPLVAAVLALAAGLACGCDEAEADRAVLDAGVAALLDAVARSAH